MITAPKTSTVLSACILLLAVGGGFVPQAAARMERDQAVTEPLARCLSSNLALAEASQAMEIVDELLVRFRQTLEDPPEAPTREAAPHAHPDEHDDRDHHPEQPDPEVEARHHGYHDDPGIADPVRETVAAFHAALARGDAEAAIALLHPEVLIYEQGHAETLDEYRAGHLAADMAFAAAVEREVIRDETVAVHGGALYLAETRTRGAFRDREIDTSGVETAFLVETPEGWRIRHFHWSSGR